MFATPRRDSNPRSCRRRSSALTHRDIWIDFYLWSPLGIYVSSRDEVKGKRCGTELKVSYCHLAGVTEEKNWKYLREDSRPLYHRTKDLLNVKPTLRLSDMTVIQHLNALFQIPWHLCINPSLTKTNTDIFISSFGFQRRTERFVPPPHYVTFFI